MRPASNGDWRAMVKAGDRELSIGIGEYRR
jgi:hypothetical protein